MMDSSAYIAIAVFVIAYMLIISEKIHRTIVALTGAMVMIIMGILSQDQAIHHIDFNTIGLLTGMMIMVNITSETGLFNYLAIWAAKKVKANPVKLLVALSALTAVCSAFLDNVTTVLLTVPVTFSITAQLKIPVQPFLIAQIMSSNIGGTATLIGDPPNIMIGSAVPEMDFMAFLTNLGDNDVLFIDEIHRLSKTVEEILYSAMEDYALDIIIGKGPSARSVRLDLPKFTLIGATTRLGAIAAPLRDRFGVQCRLEFYKPDELQFIITRAAEILGVEIAADGAEEIARRSRGTPRVANRLLKRVRDFAQVSGAAVITGQMADEALARLEVDRYGLDRNDRRILQTIVKTFCGGPVGIETIAAAVSEETDTIEDVIEPYLMQLGLLQRTPRGRIATRETYRYLGVPFPEKG